MISVLLVSENKEELEDLQRSLFAHQLQWQTRLCFNAEEALEAVNNQTFEVVVVQMEMLSMDGREVLRHVKETRPDAVRVLVSYKQDPMVMVSATAVAHRFVKQPIDVKELNTSIRSLVALQEEISVEKLRKQFDQIDLLPTPPQHIIDLNQELNKLEPSIDRVAELVTDDTSLSAKILQLVNSAAFGLSNKLADIKQATAYLGLNAMRDLAVAVELENRAHHPSPAINRLVDAVQTHSREVADLAAKFFDLQADKQDAFTAGLLHDAGLLALASIDEKKFQTLCELDPAAHCFNEIDSIPEAEQNIVGTPHASLSAYLLRNWGLPSQVIEAVAWHHNGAMLANEPFGLAHAVHIADQISRQNQRPDHELTCGLAAHQAEEQSP